MIATQTNKSGVSIVIVNYNTKEYIFDLLSSIKQFATYEPLEVIIIDNMSTDGTREDLEKYEWIKYIKLDKNVGHGPALHLGIIESKYPYVLTLDADTVILKEGLVEILLGAFEDENTFAAGPLQIVNSYGYWIPKYKLRPRNLIDYFRPTYSLINRQLIGYIGPWCALINKRIYSDRLKTTFIAHGSPGIDVYWELQRETTKGIKIVDVRINEHLHHYWGGSRVKPGAYMAAKSLVRAKGAPLTADADFVVKLFLLGFYYKLKRLTGLVYSNE